MQVKQLLSQEGAVIKENCFWMNSIKTHCYVIFETAEQAEAIRYLAVSWVCECSMCKLLSVRGGVADS